MTFDAGRTFWWEYPDSDCPYEDANTTHNPGQPINVYIANCLATPGCFGFNTDGVLKNRLWQRTEMQFVKYVTYQPTKQMCSRKIII